MSTTDPIADFMTRLRNAVKAQHHDVAIPSSKLKRELARLLKEQGYIEDYEVRRKMWEAQAKAILDMQLRRLSQLERAKLEEEYTATIKLISELESEATMPAGFILPGATPASGALDLARAITRRAERRCVTLERAGGLRSPEVRRWLNRLSLLLFVLGRYEESQAGRVARPAKRSESERSS